MPRTQEEVIDAGLGADPGGRLRACPARVPSVRPAGSPTWKWTAAHPGLTEIQAGTYVVMDNFHGKMVPGFEHSLTIQATVISRQSGR